MQIKKYEVFQALGDPTRFKLFQLAGEADHFCVGELAKKCNISSAAVSQHMKVLEKAGLVQANRSGQKVCYRVMKDSPEKRSILALTKA